MKLELQGEGNYDYACRLHDCEYCATMGLKPLPMIYEADELPVFIPRTIKKKCNKATLRFHWTKEESQVIIDNIWMNTEELSKILPGRNKYAIYARIYIMRKRSLLEPVIR